MTAREQGFLLLTGYLGDPDRKPLTVPQFRHLARLAATMEKPTQERDLTEEDLIRLGCEPAFAGRVVSLLSQEKQLQWYLREGERQRCAPITRISDDYPDRLRKKLCLDAPGTLWIKGDPEILKRPCISVVGSRELREENRQFAEEAGRQIALQGYTLVSGNARGADRVAQESCLENGGAVISVVADALAEHRERKNVLYVAEEGFNLPFSAQRALQRNRIIHAISHKTLVAQSSAGVGGTWRGTCANLQQGWSQVFCFRDNSKASLQLEDRGAMLVDISMLEDLERLQSGTESFI